MNRVPVEHLKEQAARERRRIEHYTEQIRNPTHGFTGQTAQDAEEWYLRMVAGAQSRLNQIEERIAVNSAQTKAQPLKGALNNRGREEAAQHGPQG